MPIPSCFQNFDFGICCRWRLAHKQDGGIKVQVPDSRFGISSAYELFFNERAVRAPKWHE